MIVGTYLTGSYISFSHNPRGKGYYLYGMPIGSYIHLNRERMKLATYTYRIDCVGLPTDEVYRTTKLYWKDLRTDHMKTKHGTKHRSSFKLFN